VAAKPKAATKPKVEDLRGFAIKDHVVYPSHGVGQITGVEAHEIGDISLRVFVVVFDKEKMTLRVPIDKATSSGMRKLSSQQKMEQAISTLKGRARTRRVMWSRRAQEYDAKLNSGDPVAIAEVVRDLHRDEGQPDQSYSERQMYEAALERLAREFAAVENTDTEQAAEKLENVLRAA
jgi:CarD family transcriptional regulator